MANPRKRGKDPLTVSAPDERARAVREMFAAIAPRYDRLNHLLSLNVDRFWRRRAVDRLGWLERPHGLFLDVCSGTYDLGIELVRRSGFCGRVLALDFAQAMLHHGRPKIAGLPILPLCADALRIPIPAGRCDGVMAAFGIRNLVDLDDGLAELGRVLNPGARLVLLDFAMPGRQPLKWLYRQYFTRLLPVIGRLLSKHSHAYTYLPESVLAFSEPARLAARLSSAGFHDVGWEPLSGGIACLWWGVRAPVDGLT
ncbi:MAG: ubiquinone/menaquinone biosynthesis methyltransferase [Gemmatimonadota bacterium]|nr:MAG: ubiquinone/menaquinone biosynthesis methyltransferase [Gemmatimonadota bacterium]